MTDHIVEGDSVNHQLTISVLDEPGSGGACHMYEVTAAGIRQTVDFQNGPIAETGVNGTTNEAQLAIVIDRLRSFQAGPYTNRANAIALTHIEEALMWLQQRTRERIKRGVEGTAQK